MLSIHCPHCANQHVVPEGSLGARTICQACGEPFTLSLAADETQNRRAAGVQRGPPDFEPSSQEQPSQARFANERPSRGDKPSSSPTGPVASNERIGRFIIRERLGAGAFGVVYRAHDPVLNRDVAIKLPAAGALATDEARARFLREPQAAARLRHPHIVPVYEAGFDGPRFFVASAFIAGKNLRAAIAAGEIDVRRAAEIACKLASALQSAHDQGIVHRDVKPANVMLDEQGEPQLMDFGLAQLADASAQLTTDGAVLGTPAYMAPEQAGAPVGPVGPASDQYSLGASLYEMLTGRLPFEGQPLIVLYQVRTATLQSPRSLRTEIPAELEAICMKAMAKRPEERFASCGELAQTLGRWLGGGDTRTASITGETARSDGTRRTVATQAAAAPFPPPPPLPLPPPAPFPSASISAAPPHPARQRSFLKWLGGVALIGVLLFFCAGIGQMALVSWIGERDKGGKNSGLAHRRPGEVIENSVGMKLVLIPPGDFVMGSPREEVGHQPDELQHPVRISQPFYLGVCEVTQEEFIKVTGQNISYFSPDGDGHDKVGNDTRRYPVERVSYEVAKQFCQMLSDLPAERAARRVYFLPTEAQWEYACRAGTTTAFHFGKATNGQEANLNGHAGYGELTPGPFWDRTKAVGSYEPNAFGLYDMHGNVWEWCQDWYGPYSRKAVIDPSGPAEDSAHDGSRVARGGSWYHSPARARSAFRIKGNEMLGNTLGVRVAATIEPESQGEGMSNDTDEPKRSE